MVEPTELTKHMFFSDGVNFVGSCNNPGCRIHNEEQFFEKGFGSFFVNKEVFEQKCIVC